MCPLDNKRFFTAVGDAGQLAEPGKFRKFRECYHLEKMHFALFDFF